MFYALSIITRKCILTLLYLNLNGALFEHLQAMSKEYEKCSQAMYLITQVFIDYHIPIVAL